MTTILISCGSRKAEHPLPAEELYIGSSFRLAREAAKRDGRPWKILSAKHGIVDPRWVLAPYDHTLSTAESVSRLAFRLSLQPDPGPVEAWVPKAYLEALLRAGRSVVAAPLVGLPLGKRRAWFAKHAVETASGSVEVST